LPRGAARPGERPREDVPGGSLVQLNGHDPGDRGVGVVFIVMGIGITSLMRVTPGSRPTSPEAANKRRIVTRT
jgi:hypothetical protein